MIHQDPKRHQKIPPLFNNTKTTKGTVVQKTSIQMGVAAVDVVAVVASAVVTVVVVAVAASEVAVVAAIVETAIPVAMAQIPVVKENK